MEYWKRASGDGLIVDYNGGGEAVLELIPEGIHQILGTVDGDNKLAHGCPLYTSDAAEEKKR